MFPVCQKPSGRAKSRISQSFWQSEQCKQNISGRECNPSWGSSHARKERDRAELSAWGEQPEEPLQCISRSVARETTGA